MVIPSPFVYWAQTESTVSLKIELKNVVNPDLKVLDNKVKFSALGVGARGESQYEFSLDLFSAVRPNDEQITVLRVFDNRVDVVLQKVKPSWWPRLTAQPQKPAWLKDWVNLFYNELESGVLRHVGQTPCYKINFDLWKTEDGQDSDEEKRDIMQDYPGMYDRLHQEEMGYRREDFKKVYLVMYNLFQFVGFMYVLTVIGVRYARYDYDSVVGTYENVGSAMKFLQLLQYLEVMHPLFGYTRGGVLVPFFQVSGRAFVLFLMIDAEPRMQTKPVVFYLFIIWTMIEVVRYPYYISQLYKKEIYILTWLRYTMWIPLYPLGVLCEAIVIMRNIPYFEETGKFTITMPNEWNFTFDMPNFLRVYLLLLSLPGLYLVTKHMHRLRTVKLKPKIVIKKSK